MVLKTIIFSLPVFCVSALISRGLAKFLLGFIKSSDYRVTKLTKVIMESIFVFFISLSLGYVIFRNI